jgi:hypothetical protein
MFTIQFHANEEFLCKWKKNAKKRFFQESLPTEKSFRGHADFIFGIEPSMCVETPCKKKQMIKMRFQR